MVRSLGLIASLLAVSCGAGASATPSPAPSSQALPRSATPTPTATAAPTASPSPRATPTPTALIRYVAIGASDTVGVGSADPARGSWPALLAALLPAGSTYVNLGVSGTLTPRAQTEQLPAAVRERPTLVTIWLAVNDLNAPVPVNAYTASLSAIVDTLVRDPPAVVFVGNVPDLRAVPAYAGSDQVALLARVTAYNAAIALVAGKHPGRVVVVDLFTGSAELTTNITVSQDGFHPSDEGYVLIATRFAEAMRANGVPLRPGP